MVVWMAQRENRFACRSEGFARAHVMSSRASGQSRGSGCTTNHLFAGSRIAGFRRPHTPQMMS